MKFNKVKYERDTTKWFGLPIFELFIGLFLQHLFDLQQFPGDHGELFLTKNIETKSYNFPRYVIHSSWYILGFVSSRMGIVGLQEQAQWEPETSV